MTNDPPARARLTAVLAAAALGVLGCTSQTVETRGDRPPTGTTTAPAAPEPPGSPTASPPTEPATPSQPPEPPPAYRQPLVLAVHPSRAPLDLSERAARRVAAGRVDDWAVLGEPGGRLVVARGRPALRAVTRDPDRVAVVPAHRMRPTLEPVKVGGVDPLRRPGRYPLTVPAARPRPPVTTVTVVGDIMLGRGVAAAHPGDPGAPLRPLADRLAAADVTIGNLESTLSRAGAPRQGDDSFAAPPQVLDELRLAGFDVLSLGNNHTGDFGPRALRQTVRRVDRSPIRRVGAGSDLAAAWRPAVVRADGARVGVLAFNAIGETPRATRRTPGAAEVRMPPRTGPLDRGDLDRATRAVQRLARRVDAVVVLPHWGEQYTHRPVPAQRRVGRALVEAGADVVVGGHPHWLQGIQVHRGTPIPHSLGNFVFDMDFMRQTMEGALVELVFWGGDLRGARFVPYVLDGSFTPRPVHGERARQVLAPMWAASDPPYRR